MVVLLIVPLASQAGLPPLSLTAILNKVLGAQHGVFWASVTPKLCRELVDGTSAERIWPYTILYLWIEFWSQYSTPLDPQVWMRIVIQCSDVFRGIMIADPPLRKTLWCNWPGSASTAARNDVPRLRVDFWRSVWRDPKGSQTEICHPFPAQTIAQGNGCARLGICDESSSYLPHSCSGAWFISQELVAPNEDKKIQELNHQLWSLNQYIPMMFPSYSHYIRFFHHYSPMDLMGRVAILCTVQICAVGVGCWLEHLCVWQ